MCWFVALGTALGASAANAAAVGALATAAGASVAASGMSAYGAIQQGNTSKKVAEYNADMAEMQAKDARRIGAIEGSEKAAAGRQVMARQTAAIAAGGGETSSGSALSLLSDTAMLSKLDELRTVNNAQRAAWGYTTQADLDRFQGKSAALSGKLSAGGSLLTGASQGAGYYYQYKK